MRFNVPRRRSEGRTVGSEPEEHASVLPEWGETDQDEADWIEALEASRRRQFAELADL